MRFLIALCFFSSLAMASVTSVKVDEAISYSKYTPVEKNPGPEIAPFEKELPKEQINAEDNQSNTGPVATEAPKPLAVNGVQISQGTVNDNIVRIAGDELGIPSKNVEFLYIPCPLIEKYSYVIPESKFSNRYERLTYYASKYSFFATFNEMTNTVTLEYRGPDVFETCREQK